MQNKYGFGKAVDLSFDAALARVTEELQKEGFGILTEIDVAATLKKKLNQDLPPYRILGACNPPLAYRALSAEPTIGLLLPCNVVVRQDDQGSVHVEFMDPIGVLNLVDRPEVESLAKEVRQRLDRVLANL
ncbi:MAG: hypothetical protein H6R11_543 [Proteobacteria bacterium]|jgi:uncharacterized protein (DUF302 family)|nr:hypothetical protein [Pseudomonadota bacterium]MBS1173053.1 hypothetical protein [Pseudomonadota bacterium]